MHLLRWANLDQADHLFGDFGLLHICMIGHLEWPNSGYVELIIIPVLTLRIWAYTELSMRRKDRECTDLSHSRTCESLGGNSHHVNVTESAKYKSRHLIILQWSLLTVQFMGQLKAGESQDSWCHGTRKKTWKTGATEGEQYLHWFILCVSGRCEYKEKRAKI